MTYIWRQDTSKRVVTFWTPYHSHDEVTRFIQTFYSFLILFLGSNPDVQDTTEGEDEVNMSKNQRAETPASSISATSTVSSTSTISATSASHAIKTEQLEPFSIRYNQNKVIPAKTSSQVSYQTGKLLHANEQGDDILRDSNQQLAPRTAVHDDEVVSMNLSTGESGMEWEQSEQLNLESTGVSNPEIHKWSTSSHLASEQETPADLQMMSKVERKRKLTDAKKRFPCFYCGKRFQRSGHRSDHERSHNVDLQFKCPKCPRRFTRKRVMLAHHLTCGLHKEGKYRCRTCNLSFFTKEEKTSHLRQHIEERRYKCKVCGKRYMFSSHLADHERCHDIETQFKCDYCRKTFQRRRSLNTHLKTHDVGGRLFRFRCKLCKKHFMRKEDMLYHYQKCQIIEVHKCSFCPRSFTSSSDCRNHEKNHDIQFKCSYCMKRFKTKTQLDLHEITHITRGDIKVLRCWKCRMVFQSTTEKKQHCKTHKKMIFSCRFCGKQFRYASHHRQHEKSHNMDMGMKCLFCNTKYAEKRLLAAHVRQRIAFQMCSAGCISSNRSKMRGRVKIKQCTGNVISIHKKLVGKNGKIQCKICSKAFTGYFQLKTHEVIQHQYLQRCEMCPFSCLTSEQMKEHAQQSHSDIGAQDIKEKNGVRAEESNIGQVLTAVVEGKDVGVESKEKDKDVQTKIGKYPCFYCGRRFHKCSHRTDHERTHNINMQFKCPKCKKRFSRRRAMLAHHLNCQNKAGTYDAVPEESDLVRPEEIKALNEQIRSNRGNAISSIIVGELVDKASAEERLTENNFVDERVLNYDERDMTSDLTPVDVNLGAICEFCDRTFRNQKGMLNHQKKKHKGEEKPYSCSDCKERFASKADRDAHLNVHLALRPFQCRFCPKRFKKAHHCREHELLHDVSSQIKCKYCDKGFTTKRYLQMHQQRPRSKKPWRCPKCCKLFELKSCLTYHEKVCNVEKDSEAGSSVAGETPNDSEMGCESEAADRDAIIRDYNETVVEKEQREGQRKDLSRRRPATRIEEQEERHLKFLGDIVDVHVGDNKGNHADGGEENVGKNVEGSDKVFKCKLCRVVFESQLILIKHEFLHTRNDPKACWYCNKQFQSEVLKTEHEASHRVSSHLCQNCGTFFKSEHLLQTHNCMNPQESMEYSCGRCDKRFSDPQELLDHEQGHKGRRAYSCTQCKAKFVNNASFQFHMQRDHGAQTTVDLVSARHRYLACQYCRKSFWKLLNLQMHEKGHTGPKPYVCIYCKDTFESRKLLLQHEETHAKEKPFACLVCGYRFDNNAKLKDHVFRHGESEFRCEHCTRQFSNDQELLRHEKAHADIKMYSCKDCDEKFACDLARMFHSRRKHNVHYECQLCGQEMATSSSLSKHLIDHKMKHQLPSAKLQEEFPRQSSQVKKNSDFSDDIHDGLSLVRYRQHMALTSTSNFQKSSEVKNDENSAQSKNSDEYGGLSKNFDDHDSDESESFHEDFGPSKNLDGRPCPICRKKFATSSALARHLIEHKKRSQSESEKSDDHGGLSNDCDEHDSKSKNFVERGGHPCPICQQKLATSSALARHLIEHKKRTQSPSRHESSSGEKSSSLVQKNLQRPQCVTPQKNCDSEKLPTLNADDSSKNPKTCDTEAKLSEENCTYKKRLRHRNSSGKVSTDGTQEIKVEKDIVGLKLEISEADNQEIFQCKFCQKCFKERKQCDVHEGLHSPKKQCEVVLSEVEIFPCKFCPKSFSEQKYCDAHESLHSPEKLWRCDVCGTGYFNKKSLIEHRGTEQHKLLVDQKDCGEKEDKYAEKEIKSENMVDEIATPRSLEMSSCSPKVTFKCEHCWRVFTTPVMLEKHSKTHDTIQNGISCDNGRSLIDSDELQVQQIDSDSEELGVEKIDSDSDSDEVARQQSSSSKSSYNCEFCWKVFSTLSVLENHVKVHTDPMPYRCKYCPRSFRTGDDRNNHEVVHYSERKFQCRYCGRRFKKSWHKDDHERLHNGGGKFKCEACAQCFQRPSEIWRHEQKHHGEGLYSCPKCTKKYVNFRNFQYHWKLKHGTFKPPWTLGMKLTKKSDVIKRQKKEMKSRQVNKKKDVERNFACPKCDARFVNKHHLAEHVVSHDPNSKHKCELCDKRFVRLIELWRHERQHSGPRKHKCPLCQGRFFNKDSLLYHRKTQHGYKLRLHSTAADDKSHISTLQNKTLWTSTERDNQCTECLKTFSSKNHLDEHKRLHDPNLQFHCEVCFKSFTRLINLWRHETVHKNDVGERKHKCPDCNACFFSKGSCDYHRRIQHGVQIAQRKPTRKQLVFKPSTQKVFTCSYCSKTFGNAEVARRHEGIHDDGKGYKCTYEGCSEKFTSIDVMARHFVQMHPSSFPFQCSFCFRGFKQYGHLASHEKRHQPDTLPYMCEVCKMRFERPRELYRHELSHDGDKPHKCPKCPMRCFNLVSIMYHKLSEHGITYSQQGLYKLKNKWNTKSRSAVNLNKSKKEETSKLEQKLSALKQMNSKVQQRRSPRKKEVGDIPMNVNQVECKLVLNGYEVDSSQMQHAAKVKGEVTDGNPEEQNSDVIEDVEDNVFICELCTEEFDCERELRRHKRFHAVQIKAMQSLMRSTGSADSSRKSPIRQIQKREQNAAGSHGDSGRSGKGFNYKKSSLKSKNSRSKLIQRRTKRAAFRRGMLRLRNSQQKKVTTTNNVEDKMAQVLKRLSWDTGLENGNKLVVERRFRVRSPARKELHDGIGGDKQTDTMSDDDVVEIPIVNQEKTGKSPKNQKRISDVTSDDDVIEIPAPKSPRGEKKVIRNGHVHGHIPGKMLKSNKDSAKLNSKLELNHKSPPKRIRPSNFLLLLKETEKEREDGKAFVSRVVPVLYNGHCRSCIQCGKRFDTDAALAEHKKWHKCSKRIRCLECNTWCDNDKAYRKHWKEHALHRLLYCKYCGKDFPDKESLWRHEKTHNKDGNGSGGGSSIKVAKMEEKTHVCDMCSEAFVTADELKVHQVSHTAPRAFVCEHCNMSFNQERQLRSHQTRHVGDLSTWQKSFGCPLCGGMFKSSEDLKSHERTFHGFDGKFECKYCDRSFGVEKNWRAHEKVHRMKKDKPKKKR